MIYATHMPGACGSNQSNIMASQPQVLQRRRSTTWYDSRLQPTSSANRVRIGLLDLARRRRAMVCVLMCMTVATIASGQPITIRPAAGFESGALLSIRRDPGVINHTKLAG